MEDVELLTKQFSEVIAAVAVLGAGLKYRNTVRTRRATTQKKWEDKIAFLSVPH
jgi:hypothetical protein